MKCKHCGKDLLEGAKFCVYCGKPIELEQPKPVEDVAVAPQTVNNVVEEPKTMSTSQQPVVDQQNQVAENIPQQPLPIINNTNEQKVTQSPVQPLENNIVQNSMPIQQEISKIEEPTVNSIQSFNIEEKNVNAAKTNEILQPIEEVKQEPSIIDMVTPEPVVKDTNDTLMQQDTLIKEQPMEQNVPTPIELPKEEPKNNVQPEVVTKIVKKNNPILIVIIFILLAIIIGGGIFVYTKYIMPSNNKNASNTKINKEVIEDVKEKNDVDYSIEEINEKINRYDYFLMRAFFDKKGQNLLEDLILKFSLINWTISTSKDYDNGVSQSYKYATYEDYKSQYEYLYGDSSKMDEELEKLSNEAIANTKDINLGNGYISWAGNWSPVSYTNFKLQADNVISEDNGYTVKGTYTYDDVDSKSYSGNFEIKYETSNDKEWLTSIVLN